ncbi:hypothetical protein BDQ94DRAFT_144840 [Aspergillus welwitschiae]|uniref:Uncharacterized protein n=1 Tax=Aspergillus welwitschiae TaxID=1341132 RepID=A0A3F3Q1Z6_9EURO|nr:hypothetical protein BDQ94DRAFT_144840 [Aspergillus welwitschiae]RDH32696.1 hypothetical protein BDQ94DRAFT_144840 [Aspergillus welwitschiae]
MGARTPPSRRVGAPAPAHEGGNLIVELPSMSCAMGGDMRRWGRRVVRRIYMS